MFDLVQVVLLAVIILLTLILVVLGIQVFFILGEVRKTVKKTNVILEKADSITESVRSPISALSAIALGIKTSSLLGIAKHIRSLMGNDKEHEHDKRQH